MDIANDEINSTGPAKMNIIDEQIVQIDLDQEDDLKAPPFKTTMESSEVITITEDADYMETLALADSTDESEVDDVIASNDVVVDITGDLSSRNKRKSSEISSSATIDISDDEDETEKRSTVLKEPKKIKLSDSAGNEDDIVEDFISAFNDELNADLQRS